MSSHSSLGRCQCKTTRCKQLLGKYVALQLDERPRSGKQLLCPWVLRVQRVLTFMLLRGECLEIVEVAWDSQRKFSVLHPLVRPLG